MEKSIIAEGKTTNEAIENGLKQLKVTKNMVACMCLGGDGKWFCFSRRNAGLYVGYGECHSAGV